MQVAEESLKAPLKIEGVELRELKIPLVSPFETSGWREEEKNCIIVEMMSAHRTDFGECVVIVGPWYSRTLHRANGTSCMTISLLCYCAENSQLRATFPTL